MRDSVPGIREGSKASAPLKVGFHPPEQCARGLTDCRSLAQIISSGVKTFVCCGEVLGDVSPEPRDKWAFCFRSEMDRPHCIGTDLHIYVDRRDMSHMMAVLGMGLATVIPPDDGTPPLSLDELLEIAGATTSDRGAPNEEATEQKPVVVHEIPRHRTSE